MPNAPAELVERLGRYQHARFAGFRGWAPDGSGMLIATRFGNSSQLHRVFQPGGRREQITFLDEPAGGQFVPGPGGESLLLSVDAGGAENHQLFHLDRTTFATTRLTDGKSRFIRGPLRRDGSLLALAGNQRNGRDMDLYVVDPRRPESLRRVMQVDRQSWHVADWSPDGRTLLLQRYVSVNESYAATLDVASGERIDLPSPDGQKAAIGSLAFSSDGRAIYLPTDAGDEFLRLARYDRDSKKYAFLAPDLAWDVSELVVEPKTGDVAFTINQDGASRLFLLPQGAAERRRELPLPLGIASGLEFSPDGRRLGFTLSLPTAPSDAYSLALDGGPLERWTYSETGGLDASRFIAPTLVRFPSFDGREIPAYYFRPRAADAAAQPPAPAAATTAAPAANAKRSAVRKAPVIINIHGGPESQYQPYFNSLTQFYLNELGFAVLHPNVRGSAGYGKTYLQLDNVERREDSVRDIGALLDWIARQPELDADRVAVVGGSYGGYMVLASLTHFGERIRAGVDYVGIAHFGTFLERTAAYRVDLRRVEYGDERDPKVRELFERISPLNNADKIRAALMVAHGRNDPRVPFFEAEQIAAKVRAQGRPVWTVFADNEGHGFAKKDNSDYVRAVEVMFLKKHLEPE